jgi:hypothetical protein
MLHPNDYLTMFILAKITDSIQSLILFLPPIYLFFTFSNKFKSYVVDEL